MTVTVEELARNTTLPCQVHRTHYPRPHVNHVHHVWPLGEGGPDVAANTVVACPTGHDNIHALIRLLKRYAGQVPAHLRAGYTREERRLAALGWSRIIRQAM